MRACVCARARHQQVSHGCCDKSHERSFSENSVTETFESNTCKNTVFQEIVYSLSCYCSKCISQESCLKQKICELLSDVWLYLCVYF